MWTNAITLLMVLAIALIQNQIPPPTATCNLVKSSINHPSSSLCLLNCPSCEMNIIMQSRLSERTPTGMATILLCPYFQWYTTHGPPSQRTVRLTSVLGHLVLNPFLATNHQPITLVREICLLQYGLSAGFNSPN